MENAVARYLSVLGGPSNITLCGGSMIEYEPAFDGWTGWGESWAISSPDMEIGDLQASVESQLAEYGFVKDYGLMGYKYVIRAGSESIGIMIAMDGSRLCIYMTHAPECYSETWLAEKEDYAYDPQTGILFRFGKIENDEMVYQFEVIEFDLNPATLGNFPGEP
jgi:hypothetical protein